MDGVVFLQNAWSPYFADKEWPREQWLVALARSRSGMRLSRIYGSLCTFRSMVDPDRVRIRYAWTGPVEVHFDNTTPRVASRPEEVLPPDFKHIESVLDKTRPRYVLACGKQSGAALRQLWPGPLICMPHPTWKPLSNKTLDLVRSIVEQEDFDKRITIVQPKGGEPRPEPIPEFRRDKA